MSDIPLRSLRRNWTQRSNYIPLAGNDDAVADEGPSGSGISDKSNDMPMSTSITKAAVVGGGNARRNGKMRAKDRYMDDPEEEERLLGGSYDGSDGVAGESARPPSPAKVCCEFWQ